MVEKCKFGAPENGLNHFPRFCERCIRSTNGSNGNLCKFRWVGGRKKKISDNFLIGFTCNFLVREIKRWIYGTQWPQFIWGTWRACRSWIIITMEAWSWVRFANQKKKKKKRSFLTFFRLALMEIYPEYEWHWWKFGQTSSGLWKDVRRQRQFTDWLATQLGIDPLDYHAWEQVGVSKFQELGGSYLFLKYASGKHKKWISARSEGHFWLGRYGTLEKAIRRIYPESWTEKSHTRPSPNDG